MNTRSILSIVAGVVLLSLAGAGLAAAQSSVGIYSDVSGSSCSLSAPSSGPVNAYVVVRPGPGGAAGLQFAAPKPSCFAASYVTDLTAPGMLSIGNSQTGISIAMAGCFMAPTHVLTIQYSATGSTPACCAYPVINDPAVSDILVVDCAFNEEVSTGIVSTINADASCPCSGNSLPNEPDTPDPQDGATGVSVFASLGWSASDIDNNLAEFDVYLGTDPAPPLVATVTGPAYAPGQMAELTRHYWRVVARDTGGLERSSALWTFTTRAVNSPPMAPFAPDPFNGAEAVAVNPTLRWLGADIDGDTLAYDVYFGTSSTPPLVATGIGATMYAPPTLAFGTLYRWRIVARDYLGHETSGPVWSFTTRLSNYPPNVPSSPSPPNNATGVASTGVTLSWLANDADGDTLTFDLYLGTTLPPPLLAAGFGTTSYPLPDLTAGTQYYWQVVAHDATSETAGPVWGFSTAGLNLPPAVPSAPSPANSATGVSPPVYLQWFCSDPNGDALTYNVYFGTSPSPPLFAAGVQTRSVNAGPLATLQQYFWRIVARDSHGAETSGPLWTFTTKGNTPPAAPSSPSPPDGSTGRSTNSVLAWQCSDIDQNTITYDVYFGTMSPPPLLASNHPVKNYGPGLLAFNTLYYWKIVARDAFGAETPGPEWTFSTGANSPPNAPSNPFPGNGGSTSTVPTLGWSATDPDGQPLTYDVYFGTQSDPPLAASGLANRSYQPGALQESTIYFWRVVASDGDLSTSGPIWSFLATVPIPGGASRVAIYSDVSGTDCSLSDVVQMPLDVYIFVRPVGGATGLEFAAPKPACFTGIYLGENNTPGTLAIGNSQEGISMALGGCVDFPMNVLTIHYFGLGTSLPCCEYPVIPDPAMSSIIVVDCNFAELSCTGVALTINEDVYCPCGALLPVLISSFEARALDAGVQVRWELSGDESADRYTLLRREGDATYPQVVQQGAVTGATGSYLDATVEPATTYHYELMVRTADGNEFRSPVATVTTRAVALSLGQNHPNPFNPTTVIPYTLPGGSTPARVRLLILDVSGGVVRTLVDEPQAGGPHEAVWDGRDDRGGPVSSGVYFCVLDADGQRNTRKMVLLK